MNVGSGGEHAAHVPAAACVFARRVDLGVGDLHRLPPVKAHAAIDVVEQPSADDLRYWQDHPAAPPRVGLGRERPAGLLVRCGRRLHIAAVSTLEDCR